MIKVWVVAYFDAYGNVVVKMFKKEPTGLLKSPMMIDFKEVWLNTGE